MYHPTPSEQAWLDTLPTHDASDWLRMMSALEAQANSLSISIEEYTLFCQEYDHLINDGWGVTMTKEQYVTECVAQLKGE
jgi:hypothetical protein